MEVGVNYPWKDYGWDFGLGPPSWRGGRTTPRWYDEVDGHLRHLHDLGITVVRWFILADGFTYGTGSTAPKLTPGGWRFDPPPLDTEAVTHFEELLRRFETFNAGRERAIRLLPVFVDFQFCDPGFMPLEIPDAANPLRNVPDPGWVKKGRADAIVDAGKRVRFLDRALDPLLEVSKQHADAIYAWELINEPDWITNTWHPDRLNNHPADPGSMRAFLEDGKGRVRGAGFKPTIGFNRIETLRLSGITAEINQFHHYPGGRTRLQRHTFHPSFPGILGEFATDTRDAWPDLAPGGQSVFERLRFAAAQGYPLAIPWSFRTRDQHTSWTDDVERQIKSFTGLT